MFHDLKEKVVVVTGAAGGMGGEIALQFGKAGACVALVDRDGDALQRVAHLLGDEGVSCLPFTCDLRGPGEIKATADAVKQAFGNADILVNNAGVLPQAQNVEEVTADVWDLVFSVNVRGAFLCAQAFGRQMLEKGSGSVVSVASIAAAYPNAHAAYGPSKAAVLALTRQLAVEWGPRGVRANAVSPGMIMTPMTTAIYENSETFALRSRAVAMREIGKVSDVANAIAFLASESAHYINGQEIVVDGGFTRTGLMRMQPPNLQPQPPY